MLTESGIEGDWQRNRRYHGVLMIASELLEDLIAQGYPLYPGALGENLTVTGLDAAQWTAGQRYRIGDEAVIELTTLRVPCVNLHVYGRPIVKELARPGSKAGGFYARVITPGMVVPGAPVVALPS